MAHVCNAIMQADAASSQKERIHVPEFKVLASLNWQLQLGLAYGALETQHDLLRRLGLFVEHGLRLSSVSALLAVVTTLTLREQGCLADR